MLACHVNNRKVLIVSAETSKWLNTMTLIGLTDQRGMAWHYRASDQGDEPNHYPGFIPMDDVLRRLFNFEIEQAPLYIKNPATGEMTEVDGKRANVCSDNGDVLGIFSDSYEGHSYKQWLIDNIGTILDDELGIANAVLLRNRAVAMVQVEVPDTFETPDGIQFRPNLMAATSYDGSLATIYKRTCTNIVCDNTMMIGLNEDGQQFKLKHTKNSQLRIAEAREALNIIYDTADQFTEQINLLCNTKVSDQEWARVLNALNPIPEDDGRAQTTALSKRFALQELWGNDDRVTPWKNTGWGVIQTFNTYNQHFAQVRKVHRAERAYMNALTGKTDIADNNVLSALSSIVGKELVSA